MQCVPGEGNYSKGQAALISLVSQVAGEPGAHPSLSRPTLTSHHHHGLSVHAAAKGKDDRVELAGRGGSAMQILQQSSVVKKGMPHHIFTNLQEPESWQLRVCPAAGRLTGGGALSH